MDAKNNNLDDYIDWSGYEVDAPSAKEIKENLIKRYEGRKLVVKPKESVVEFDDSIDWDIYEPSVVETVSSKAPPIHPIQSLDAAVKIIMPAIKKAKGNGRGKGWYKKEATDKKTGKVYGYWRLKKQFTYRGKKYRLDCESHAEFKQRKKQIKKEADLLANSFNPDDRKATYSQAFIPFLDDEEVKPESLARRFSIFKVWIEPELGKSIVHETNGKQVDDFFKRIKKKAYAKTSLKNPPSTVKEVYNVLNAFFNFCHDSQRFILENPTMPKTTKWINKRYLNHQAEQDDKKEIDIRHVKLLMKHVAEKLYEIVYHWLTYHGMRSSEALAIEWKHIDFNNNRVMIHQQTARNNGKTFIKRYTKTNEKRWVDLAPQTKKLLLPTPKSQREGLVFTKPNGRIDVEDDFHNRVHLKSLFELGLIENKKIVSPNDTVLREKHALRVFFSSYNQQMGEDVAKVSKWLGHKDKQTTLNHYTRVIYDGDKLISTNNLMSNFLDEGNKQPDKEISVTKSVINF